VKISGSVIAGLLWQHTRKPIIGGLAELAQDLHAKPHGR